MEFDNWPSETVMVMDDTLPRFSSRGVPVNCPVAVLKFIHSGRPSDENVKLSLFGSLAVGVKLRPSPTRIEETSPEIIGGEFAATAGGGLLELLPPQDAKVSAKANVIILFKIFLNWFNRMSFSKVISINF
jgi:hypothetical protein